MITSAKLKCRDVEFPGDNELSVDLLQVLNEMIRSLNMEPEAYEEHLEDARALAAKLGVSIDPSEVPAKQPKTRIRG